MLKLEPRWVFWRRETGWAGHQKGRRLVSGFAQMALHSLWFLPRFDAPRGECPVQPHAHVLGLSMSTTLFHDHGPALLVAHLSPSVHVLMKTQPLFLFRALLNLVHLALLRVGRGPQKD